MSVKYAYNYAIIWREDNMCIEVRTCTDNEDNASNDTYLFVRIPTENYSYLMKYYDEATGKWYLDAAMTQEWMPPVA